jgi:RNA polymerase sigma-70 factor (ECF subfamily)
VPRSIADAHAAALERHPRLAVTLPGFAAFVAERLGETVPEDDVAADLLLACGCAEGDEAALRVFDDEHLRDVPRLVARVERDAAAVEEIKQRLRERLLLPRDEKPPRIADYRGKGRLTSWLRVAAIRIALDLQASRPSAPRADVDLVQRDPELDYLRERYRDAFREAFTAALDELEGRDRTVLRMHLLDGLGIDRIGQLYEVHRATAARWLDRARAELFEATRRRLRERLGVSASEFASIARLVQSDLDVSVCRILRERE